VRLFAQVMVALLSLATLCAIVVAAAALTGFVAALAVDAWTWGWELRG